MNPYDDPPGWCDRHALPQSECDCGRWEKVLTRSQLQHLPPVRSSIAGVLSRPSAAVLVGSYGVGKTFVALSMAASLATGRPWLGRDVEPVPVLYVIGEGASGLHDRVSAWELGYNDRQPIGDDRLRFLVLPGSINSEATWSQIRGYRDHFPFGAIWLDTFSSLAPDADETRDAAMVMHQLNATADAIDGPAVLVHHPGWSDNGRVRGGYQLEANASEVLVLTGTPDEPLVTLQIKKRKEGASGERIWMQRRPFGPSLIIESASAADATAPWTDRLVQVLDNYGAEGVTASYLLDELGATEHGRSAVYKALNSLRDDGVVVKEDRQRGARWWLASHVPAGGNR